MRILLVKGNKRLAYELKEHLSKHYIVDLVFEGQSALDEITDKDYVLITLDLALPDMDGLEVCKKIRNNKSEAPILVLTSVRETSKKVELLDAGADDYLTRPFDYDELDARIRALLRRSKGKAKSVIEFNGTQLDPSKRTFSREDKEIKLRRKEFDILEYMMLNSGRVLTRQMILNQVWDYTDNPTWKNTIDVHINHLRNKIDKPFDGKDLIQTVHGVGYKFH